MFPSSLQACLLLFLVGPSSVLPDTLIASSAVIRDYYAPLDILLLNTTVQLARQATASIGGQPANYSDTSIGVRLDHRNGANVGRNGECGVMQ